MPQQRLFVSSLTIILLSLSFAAVGQDDQPEDIEKTRLALVERWGVDGIVKPAEVDNRARELLNRPLAEQSDDELRELAAQANTAANLVGFILEEYQDYYRDNVRYDFVQERVAPFHDAYVELSNRMKGYRNAAYFNLGEKAAGRGDEIAAFFMYRDAFRLSSFTKDEGDHIGLRYAAEVQMKKLLGIESMGTFVYWK